MRNAFVASCLVSIAAMLPGVRAADEEKHPFEIEGMYVEGCSCKPPCPCELTGVEMGCIGVGAFRFTAGKYLDTSLEGCGFAYATEPGSWVRIYVDAKEAKQREAVTALAKAALREFGTCESVKDAKIEIAGADGKYSLNVEEGKVMSLSTEPILGGDGKTPLVYSNIHNPLHPDVMQGKTVACEYKDDKHSFKLEKGDNAYFHTKLKSAGKL